MIIFLEFLRLAFPVTHDWRTSLMLDRFRLRMNDWWYANVLR